MKILFLTIILILTINALAIAPYTLTKDDLTITNKNKLIFIGYAKDQPYTWGATTRYIPFSVITYLENKWNEIKNQYAFYQKARYNYLSARIGNK